MHYFQVDRRCDAQARCEQQESRKCAAPARKYERDYEGHCGYRDSHDQECPRERPEYASKKCRHADEVADSGNRRVDVQTE